MAQRCIAPLLRIVPWTPTFVLSSKASPSGEVIPAKNPFHGCKYSTGRSHTVWFGGNCNCQFKEGHQTYIIQFIKYSVKVESGWFGPQPERKTKMCTVRQEQPKHSLYIS